MISNEKTIAHLLEKYHESIKHEDFEIVQYGQFSLRALKSDVEEMKLRGIDWHKESVAWLKQLTPMTLDIDDNT